MITKQDLEEAIAECKGQRNPNANTCIKLAAFLTLQREMYGHAEVPAYSFASAPEPERITDVADSEFLQAVKGKDTESVMKIMDELMDSMQVLQPRIYDSVIRKVQNL